MSIHLPVFSLVTLFLVSPGSVQTSTKPQVAEMTLRGCLRSKPANPADPKDSRVIYTLEVAKSATPDRPKAVGATGQHEPHTMVYELSADESKGLAKHVGHEIEVTGELLQPPGTPPGVTGAEKPLPHDSKGTFRVSTVKVLSTKCGR